MIILITGAGGFIGKNLTLWIARYPEHHVIPFDMGKTQPELRDGLAQADLVYHLAGVNRPQSEIEFQTGNVDLTAQICNALLEIGRPVPIVFASSVQAALANPYGVSKRQAEELVQDYARRSGARAVIYRLTNVFGKWCRPNYNSVVATFCHNLARGLPITISDPARELELVYIDDVMQAFAAEIGSPDSGGVCQRDVAPTYRITLGRLAETIQAFQQMRETLVVPDLADELTRKLYGTYVSYLEPSEAVYSLQQRSDARGSLAEFLKSPLFGQIFISRTLPGVTRGNHYHHTKSEKFLVLEGEAVIRLRPILGGEVQELRVCGKDFQVVDIPTGYTHSIENTGSTELVTLFWATELFDPARPDTFALNVLS